MNLYTKKEARYCNNPKKGRRNAGWNVVNYQIERKKNTSQIKCVNATLKNCIE